MAAIDSLNCLQELPMAHAPKPTGVIDMSELPSFFICSLCIFYLSGLCSCLFSANREHIELAHRHESPRPVGRGVTSASQNLDVTVIRTRRGSAGY
jgi:hypothetical protein